MPRRVGSTCLPDMSTQVNLAARADMSRRVDWPLE